MGRIVVFMIFAFRVLLHGTLGAAQEVFDGVASDDGASAGEVNDALDHKVNDDPDDQDISEGDEDDTTDRSDDETENLVDGSDETSGEGDNGLDDATENPDDGSGDTIDEGFEEETEIPDNGSGETEADDGLDDETENPDDGSGDSQTIDEADDGLDEKVDGDPDSADEDNGPGEGATNNGVDDQTGKDDAPDDDEDAQEQQPTITENNKAKDESDCQTMCSSLEVDKKACGVMCSSDKCKTLCSSQATIHKALDVKACDALCDLDSEATETKNPSGSDDGAATETTEKPAGKPGNGAESTDAQDSSPATHGSWGIRDPHPDLTWLVKGYDLAKSNPKKVYSPDNGYQNEIFKELDAQTIKSRQGVELNDIEDCTVSFSSEDLKSSEDYKTSMESMVTVKGSGWGAKFSASVDYKHFQEMHTKEHKVFTQSKIQCKNYRATLERANLPPFKKGFLDQVERLPLEYVKTDYRDFIENYGTHFIQMIEMGSMYGKQYEYTMREKEEFEKTNLKVSAAASYDSMGYSAGVETSVGWNEEQRKAFSSISQSSQEYTLGSLPPTDGKTQTWLKNMRQNSKSEPVFLELESMDFLFREDSPLWESRRSITEKKEMCEDRGERKVTCLQDNMIRAVDEYLKEKNGKPKNIRPAEYYSRSSINWNGNKARCFKHRMADEGRRRRRQGNTKPDLHLSSSCAGDDRPWEFVPVSGEEPGLFRIKNIGVTTEEMNVAASDKHPWNRGRRYLGVAHWEDQHADGVRNFPLLREREENGKSRLFKVTLTSKEDETPPRFQIESWLDRGKCLASAYGDRLEFRDCETADDAPRWWIDPPPLKRTTTTTTRPSRIDETADPVNCYHWCATKSKCQNKACDGGYVHGKAKNGEQCGDFDPQECNPFSAHDKHGFESRVVESNYRRYDVEFGMRAVKFKDGGGNCSSGTKLCCCYRKTNSPLWVEPSLETAAVFV